MLSSTIRRSLLSLLAVSTVGTLGFSAAATLNVASEDLSAGSDTLATDCAGIDIDVDWGIAWDSVNTQYVVDTVDLIGPADFDTLCSGWDLRLDFMGASGVLLAPAQAGTQEFTNLVIVGQTHPVTLLEEVPAASILHVGVVFSDDADFVNSP